ILTAVILAAVILAAVVLTAVVLTAVRETKIQYLLKRVSGKLPAGTRYSGNNAATLGKDMGC
ncbi:hypothetical protein CWB98_01100, partial [Pseudoalteromonas rubra]